MSIHHTRLKKAKGLIGALTDATEITKLLLENKFTEDEVGEILAGPANPGDNNAKAPVAPAKKSTDKKTVKSDDASQGYDEYRCEIKIERNPEGKEIKRYAEKMKAMRKNVKISEQEADALNNGALYSPRGEHVIMYFKPE